MLGPTGGGPECKYSKNEDGAFVATSKQGKRLLISVVDGAGGSDRGIEAARIISELSTMRFSRITTIDENPPTQNSTDCIQYANKRVNQLLRNEQGVAEGYACAVFCIIDSETGEHAISVAGDSRGLIIVERPSKHATRTVIARQTALQNEAGEKYARDGRVVDKNYLEAPRREKSTILQAIGTDTDEPDPEPDTISFTPQKGDKITVVLASDGGLGDRVSDEDVYRIHRLTKDSPGNGKLLQRRLERLALSRNGKDNIKIQYGPNDNDQMTLNNGKDSDNITIAVVQTQY